MSDSRTAESSHILTGSSSVVCIPEGFRLFIPDLTELPFFVNNAAISHEPWGLRSGCAGARTYFTRFVSENDVVCVRRTS